MKKITATIEKGESGFGIYIEKNPLPYGISGSGATVDEAIEDFMSAYNEMREFYEEEGSKFVEAEFSYIYDIPSFLQYYAFAFSLAGLENITGINQRQLSHYINGVNKPRPGTIAKIERSIQAFGRELAGIRLA